MIDPKTKKVRPRRTVDALRRGSEPALSGLDPLSAANPLNRRSP
jgi:hypothetical protein